MIEGTLTNAEKVVYTAHPTTASDRPAQLDPENVLRAELISGDGTAGVATFDTIELLSGTAEGDTTFVIRGDRKPGTEEEFIEETVVLHVTAELASNMGGSLGAPVPK